MCASELSYKIVLKYIMKKMGCELDWIPSGWGLGLGFCDDGDEPLDSITVTLVWPAEY
jgi:hypothetical protein